MNATFTYNAVVEKGAFRLLSPVTVNMPEGLAVRLIVQPIESPEDILKLATSVYEGFSQQDVEELEEILLERENFFKDREDGV